MLDKYICDLFSLFKGIRSKDEDEEIADVVYSQLWNEVCEFIRDNLDMGRQALFIAQVIRIRNAGTDIRTTNSKIWDLINEFLVMIPDSKVKLEYRLTNFVTYFYLETARGRSW
jgi:hypothetical protein